MVEIIPQILESMQQHGITPTEEIITDGELHRFHVSGDNPSKRNGWVIVNMGAFPHAYFGSWKTGKKHSWYLKQPTTAAERKAAKKVQAELRAQYQAAKKEKQEKAAETARALLDQAGPADPDHPYLVKKNIRPHGILQLEGTLLIPTRYAGNVVSLQAIYKDGSKSFLKGGVVNGCSFTMGIDPKKIIVCEGVATGATLRETFTDSMVVCAFTAGNMALIAKYLRVISTGSEITIAADNDTETEGNPGLTAGRKAALAVDGELMYPIFDHLECVKGLSDFNDYVNCGGQL